MLNLTPHDQVALIAAIAFLGAAFLVAIISHRMNRRHGGYFGYYRDR